MRLTKIISIMICFVVSLSFAQKNFYVVPKKDKLPVYKNEVRQMNEKAIETVNQTEQLKVIESSKNHYKVRTDNGTIGWVEKKFAKKTQATVETFEDVEVQGYLDNPTPLYITDMDQEESAPVDIDRSFKDALKRNADKETISRTM